MRAYGPRFWRHTVLIFPRSNSRDGSLGTLAIDGAPVEARANVQANPSRGGREEMYGGTQSSKPYRVYIEPTAGLPPIEAETRIRWGNLTLTALDTTDDRGGYGVALLVHCTEIR